MRGDRASCVSIATDVNIESRNEFKKNAAVDKKDFAAIEYLLRKGHRQLEIYSAPGITNINP